tara:strand:+ start:405 stop:665 length:261 start_codon:yes stop_codon:yes gene_type:complete
MASPIEHFLVILSDAIEKKHEDMDLARYAKRVAQECSGAGFPGKDGFTGDDPNNKKIAKITLELNKKYKLFPYSKEYEHVEKDKEV